MEMWNKAINRFSVILIVNYVIIKNIIKKDARKLTVASTKNAVNGQSGQMRSSAVKFPQMQSKCSKIQ